MDFYTKYYSQLIDYVVTGVEFDTDEFDGTVFPVLLMMHPSGETVRVVVSSDEEGNGAGFLFVEEANMPLDPAQRHQIEQDAITAAWEAK
jgi:hypothetical protein